MQENVVIFAGHLGRDAEVFATKEGGEVVTLSIANTRKSKDGTEKTTWLNAKIWGKEIGSSASLYKKGDNIFVKGTLETREWTDKTTGLKRSQIELWASSHAKIPKTGESFTKAKVTSALPYKDSDELDQIPF